MTGKQKDRARVKLSPKLEMQNKLGKGFRIRATTDDGPIVQQVQYRKILSRLLPIKVWRSVGCLDASGCIVTDLRHVNLFRHLDVDVYVHS